MTRYSSHFQDASHTFFTMKLANFQYIFVFNADTDHYFIICNLPCYSLVYMLSDDTCFV